MYGALTRWQLWQSRIGGMKVSKKTANIMLIAGFCLGMLFVFGRQFEYPRIANLVGNPPWLGNVLTGLTIACGALAAFGLFRKPNSD